MVFEELAELAGQRNAIDGRIVDIVTEIERDGLCGMTGARSVAALVAWKLGSSSANAHTITTVAGRLGVFPRCAQGMREGRYSLDQIGVIAARAGQGSFGTAADAQRAVDRVRGIHRRVHGVAADGRAYTATDPHLLEWVHVAEIDSFRLAHRLYGAAPLHRDGRDGYVADMARVAAQLGVVDPPRTERELAERIKSYRPELRSTAAARDAARYLLLTPPLPMVARAPYAVLAATSVAMLPPWARTPLLLPYFPPLERTVVRAAGRALVSGIRWAMAG